MNKRNANALESAAPAAPRGDGPQAVAASDAAVSAKPGGRRIRLAVALLGVLAVASAVYWLAFVRGIVYSDDARVAADLVDVAPQIGGTMTELAVHEGDAVQPGQILYKLDATALEAAMASAQANVDGARARLAIASAEADKAMHGPRAAELRIAVAGKESADAQASLAEADWKRTQTLFAQKVVTEAERQRAQTAWERAQRAQAEAEGRLKLLDEGTRAEDLAAARANVQRAEADVAAAEAAATQAKVNLEHAEVHAPFAGIVVRKWRDAGAMVGVGTPVVTILNPATLHVAANIDEKDLGEVAVGDSVDIAIDAHPDAPLKGHITSVLRATNSQFGLIPAEGVSGTFIKVAQRVPLVIAFDTSPDALRLGPGLSVEVRVHSGSHPSPSAATSARD